MAAKESLKERLLQIMDRKDHWAWPRFAQPGLSKDQLLIHFRHEYQTYVRDFPVLLARVLGLGPPADVRAALAENIFEEETGKLSLSVPHPQLFLEMMSGLGFTKAQLEAKPLAEQALIYRRYLEDVSAGMPWQVGAAVLTIFVEGNVHERANMAGEVPERSIEEIINNHPVVVHHGCPPEKMRLVKAHHMVEGGHRDDAWAMVLGHIPEGSPLEEQVVLAVEGALRLWLAYRDGVAQAIGLHRPSDPA